MIGFIFFAIFAYAVVSLVLWLRSRGPEDGGGGWRGPGGRERPDPPKGPPLPTKWDVPDTIPQDVIDDVIRRHGPIILKRRPPRTKQEEKVKNYLRMWRD